MMRFLMRLFRKYFIKLILKVLNKFSEEDTKKKVCFIIRQHIKDKVIFSEGISTQALDIIINEFYDIFLDSLRSEITSVIKSIGNRKWECPK